MKQLLQKFFSQKKSSWYQTLLVGYAYALGSLILIDSLWLSILAKPIYQHYIGYIMPSSPNWFAVVLFYLLYPVGLMFFALQPSQGNLRKATKLGALFGVFAFATFELSNWAVIYEWPWQIVWIDIAWGVCLSAMVSGLTVYLFKKTY